MCRGVVRFDFIPRNKMGLCCSQTTDVPLRNTQSFAQITNATLQLRRPTTELSSSQCDTLVQEKINLAHEWFCDGAREVLAWTNPAQTSQEFSDTLQSLAAQTQNFFRSLFLQGTSGENVSFSRIATAQKSLTEVCFSDFELLRFCNDYKSWSICSRLKRTSISLRSKSQAMKLFASQARGPFHARGKHDLEQLLTLDKEERLEALESQIELDREILQAQQSEAQEHTQVCISDVFDCRPLDEGKATSVRASLLEFIDRLPSRDGWDSGSSDYSPNHDNLPDTLSTGDE